MIYFCKGADLKAQECEKKQGYVIGNFKEMPEIKTDKDCKTKCEQDTGCWAWSFLYGQTCRHYSTASQLVSAAQHLGGLCFGKSSDN